MTIKMPWCAITAQALALRRKRPIVTQCEEGVWVIYGPTSQDSVRGGYTSFESARRTARSIYKREPTTRNEILQRVEDVRLASARKDKDSHLAFAQLVDRWVQSNKSGTAQTEEEDEG